MTVQPTRQTPPRFAIVAMTIAIAFTAGCDAQAEPGVAIRDFVIDFARSALAAFLL
ncbi:hypothetical protein RAS1_22880 [Phycisphaerae bacterium RAS1]|nr:hypothetical protein RAS1_22880 [Phycisphaerae bacterium RAS1]